MAAQLISEAILLVSTALYPLAIHVVINRAGHSIQIAMICEFDRMIAFDEGFDSRAVFTVKFCVGYCYLGFESGISQVVKGMWNGNFLAFSAAYS